jgi:hypothetical protein
MLLTHRIIIRRLAKVDEFAFQTVGGQRHRRAAALEIAQLRSAL